MDEGSPPESLKPLKYRRFRRSVPVKKHARSSLDGRRRISVPCPHDPCRACPHDPCPDLASRNMGPFLWKKKRLRQRTHKPGASRNMRPFLWEEKHLWQRTHKPGASEIWGLFFVGKKRLRQRTHKLRASRNLAPLGFRPKNKVFERPG